MGCVAARADATEHRDRVRRRGAYFGPSRETRDGATRPALPDRDAAHTLSESAHTLSESADYPSQHAHYSSPSRRTHYPSQHTRCPGTSATCLQPGAGAGASCLHHSPPSTPRRPETGPYPLPDSACASLEPHGLSPPIRLSPAPSSPPLLCLRPNFPLRLWLSIRLSFPCHPFSLSCYLCISFSPNLCPIAPFTPLTPPLELLLFLFLPLSIAIPLPLLSALLPLSPPSLFLVLITSNRSGSNRPPAVSSSCGRCRQLHTFKTAGLVGAPRRPRRESPKTAREARPRSAPRKAAATAPKGTPDRDAAVAQRDTLSKSARRLCHSAHRLSRRQCSSFLPAPPRGAQCCPGTAPGGFLTAPLTPLTAGPGSLIPHPMCGFYETAIMHFKASVNPL